MSRLLVFLFVAVAVGVSWGSFWSRTSPPRLGLVVPSYGAFVGTYTKQQPKSCGCPTPAKHDKHNADWRKCGPICYRTNQQSGGTTPQKCYVGTTATTSGDKTNGEMVCSDTETRCGSPVACKEINVAGQGEWMAYSACAAKDAECFNAATAGTVNTDTTTGDLTCPSTRKKRCGWYCYDEATKKCFKNDGVSDKTNQDGTINALPCIDADTRCGTYCMDSTKHKCWPALTGLTTNTAETAKASIACGTEQKRCHAGTFRSKDTICGFPNSDRYCFDPTKKQKCWVGTTDTPAGSESGDTWVCGETEVRCGYGCMKDTATNTASKKDRCISDSGEVSTGDKSLHPALLCTNDQKRCNNQCYDSTKKFCWNGSRKTDDVLSGATYLCDNSVGDADVGHCSCQCLSKCTISQPSCGGCAKK